MKAIVSITVDDEFVVHDIKVIEGDKGLFIAMPSSSADGEYRDIAHPDQPGNLKDPWNYFGSIQYGIGRTDCITL